MRHYGPCDMCQRYDGEMFDMRKDKAWWLCTGCLYYRQDKVRPILAFLAGVLTTSMLIILEGVLK